MKLLESSANLNDFVQCQHVKVLTFSKENAMPVYAVRRFQSRETVEWVESLGGNRDLFVPLPFTARQDFRGLIILLRNFAFIWDRVRVESGNGETVNCGSLEDQPIRSVTNLFPEGKPMRRTAIRRGPHRIAYCDRWEEWAE